MIGSDLLSIGQDFPNMENFEESQVCKKTVDGRVGSLLHALIHVPEGDVLIGLSANRLAALSPIVMFETQGMFHVPIGVSFDDGMIKESGIHHRQTLFSQRASELSLNLFSVTLVEWYEALERIIEYANEHQQG